MKLSCHLCMISSDSIPTFVCSKTHCKQSFCLICIQEHFNPLFTQQSYVTDCWVCFCCGKSCKCIRCKGLDNERKVKFKVVKRKPIYKPKEQIPHTAKIHNKPNSQRQIKMSQLVNDKPQQQIKMSQLVNDKPQQQIKMSQPVNYKPQKQIKVHDSFNLTQESMSHMSQGDVCHNQQFCHDQTLSFCNYKTLLRGCFSRYYQQKQRQSPV